MTGGAELFCNSYVDEMNSTDDLDPSSAPALMCLVEELKGGMGADERVLVGMVVISASTGDVVWDEFEGKSFCSVSRGRRMLIMKKR